MSRAGLSPQVVVLRAAQMADASGFEAVTLAAVARSLGVQTPSLYAHVRDLAALHDAITAQALGELSTRVADGIAGRSQRDALTAFAGAHRTFAHEHPGQWQSLQRRAGPAAVDSDAARRIVHVTDAVLLGYGITGSARVHAIRIVGSAINGFLNLERVGSFDHTSPAATESWPELIDDLHHLLLRRHHHHV